jgi:hypothetical protein
MFLRKLHLLVGAVAAPFLLVTAGTGAYILLTNDYRMLRWHSWFKWGGFGLGLCLVLLAMTGAVIWTNTRIMQARRRKAGRKAILPVSDALRNDRGGGA